MNCIIIDDEQMARAIIEEMILTRTHLSLNASFDRAIEAIKFLNNNAVDLIFLDINMPTFDGFDFIQAIKNPPKIILTTSDKNFAFTAFEYGCIVDYLVKPITLDRFKIAVDKVKWFIQSPNLDDFINELKPENYENHKLLYRNINRKLVKVEIPSISLTVPNGNYTLIETITKIMPFTLP